MDEKDYVMNEWEEDVEMIDKSDVGDKCSSYGNSFYVITEEQIKDLLTGKVIYTNDGEYCQFIALKKDSYELEADHQQLFNYLNLNDTYSEGNEDER